MEEILIGTTDRTILVFIPDPASTTGAGKTGLVAASLTVTYTRVETDNDVVHTDVTSSLNNLSTLTDAHNDWGLLEVSSTLSKGLYRLDVADAVFATGAWYAVVQVTITSGTAAATPKAFKLINFDLFGQSATDLKDFVDTGYDPSAHKVQGVVLTDTATTLTNLPSITAGWLTAAGIAADAITAAKIADGAIDAATFAAGAINAAAIASDAITDAKVASDVTIASVTGAVGSVTGSVGSVVGNVGGNVTGSVGSVVGAVGSVTGNVGGNVTGSIGSLATQAKADVNTEADAALSDIGATSARFGYVDNLNIGGNVASSAEVTSVQNNTRVVRVVPEVIERPDSGTTTYRIELLLYDDVGNMEAPDSAPTVALVNQAGTDKSSRLDSTTMTLVSTGRYRSIYTADVGDTLEQLVWTFSVAEGGATRLYGNTSVIVDTTAVDFTAADRTKLDTLAADYTTARAAKIDNLDATVSSRSTLTQTQVTGGAYSVQSSSCVLGDTRIANLDAAVSTRLASASYTAPPSAATVASQVRTELTTELGRIDAAISTRQASIWSSSSATVNLSGTTIKTATDVETDTDDIKSRLPAALTGAGNMKSDTLALNGSTDAAGLLSLSARTMYSGTVTGSPTTTSFIDTGAASYGETDQFKGRIIIFHDAEHIVKEATNITAFNPATNAFTFAALSRAPTAGDAFVIV